jgi:hypothetical protein
VDGSVVGLVSDRGKFGIGWGNFRLVGSPPFYIACFRDINYYLS